MYTDFPKTAPPSYAYDAVAGHLAYAESWLRRCSAERTTGGDHEKASDYAFKARRSIAAAFAYKAAHDLSHDELQLACELSERLEPTLAAMMTTAKSLEGATELAAAQHIMRAASRLEEAWLAVNGLIDKLRAQGVLV